MAGKQLQLIVFIYQEQLPVKRLLVFEINQ